MCELGLSMKPHSNSQLPQICNRTAITGSNIGCVAATQEVIELCAQHQIFPDCQTIKAIQIDQALDQLLGYENKDEIRYVIDVKASLNDDFVPKHSESKNDVHILIDFPNIFAYMKACKFIIRFNISLRMDDESIRTIICYRAQF